MIVNTGLKPTQFEVHELPPSLQGIVDVIGLKATLALISHHGGIRVYVPQQINSDHRLAKQIGLRGARALAKCFPGELLFVPRAAQALRAVRNDEIRKQHEEGDSAAKIARRFALTERQVFTILGNADTLGDRQSELF